MLDDYLKVADAVIQHGMSRDNMHVYKRFPPHDVSGG